MHILEKMENPPNFVRQCKWTLGRNAEMSGAKSPKVMKIM